MDRPPRLRPNPIVGSLTLTTLLVGSLFTAGCKPDFGVELKIDPQELTSAQKKAARTGMLIVTGAESFTSPGVDVTKAIKTLQMHLHYTPRVYSGRLTLSFVVVDDQNQPVASGTSAPVELVPGSTVEAFLRLQPGGLAPPGDHDMGGDLSVDMESVDMARGNGLDMRSPGMHKLDMASDMKPGSSDLGTPKPQGAACSADKECASAGGCVDGYCCDNKCGDACKACNVAGMLGTCSPVAAGALPLFGHQNCGPDSQNSCGRDSTCDGAGACRKWVAGTVCKAGSCNASTNQVIQDSTCDGKGVCKPGTQSTCDPYKCGDGPTCSSSCTSKDQCSGSNDCVAGSCGPKPLGADCSNNGECRVKATASAPPRQGLL